MKRYDHTRMFLVIAFMAISTISSGQNILKLEQSLNLQTRDAGTVIELIESRNGEYLAILFYKTNEFITRLFKWEEQDLSEIPLNENTSKTGTGNLQGNLLFANNNQQLFFISPWGSVYGWQIPDGNFIGKFKSNFGSESDYTDCTSELVRWDSSTENLIGDGYFYRENSFYLWDGPLNMDKISKAEYVKWKGGKLLTSQCKFLSDGKTALMANNNKFYLADPETGRILYESEKTKLITNIILENDELAYIVTLKNIIVFNPKTEEILSTFPTQKSDWDKYDGSKKYLVTIHKKSFDLIDGMTGQIIESFEHSTKGTKMNIYLLRDESKILVIIDEMIMVYSIN